MKRLVFPIVMLLCGAATADPITYPLRVSPDSTRLLDANDAYVYINGYASQRITTRLDSADVLSFLDSLEAKSFNAMVIGMIDAPMMVHARDTSRYSIANQYDQAPFTPYDSTLCDSIFHNGAATTPDEDYWDYIGWMIDEAATRDILVLAYPTFLGYGCQTNCYVNEAGLCRAIAATPTATLQSYGIYLATKFASKQNLIWVNGGDYNPNNLAGLAAKLTAIANAIVAGDTAHLHSALSILNYSAWEHFKKPWLKINSCYSYDAAVPRELSNEAHRVSPKLPFAYLEGRYEDSGYKAPIIRRQAWWALLAGAVGHVMGHEDVWNFNLTSLNAANTNWYDSLNTKGVRSVVHQNTFRQAHPYDYLTPDWAHTFVTAGYGFIDAADYVGAALSQDWKLGVAYLPTSRTVTVNMARLAGPTVRAQWFNPATGVTTTIGDYGNTGSQQFTPPSVQDWVLVFSTITPYPPCCPTVCQPACTAACYDSVYAQ